MKEKSTIVILANKYPNFLEPNVNVFTQQVVWSFADLGFECIVICPIAMNYNLHNFEFPRTRIEKSETGKEILIYHPRYLGMGQNGKIMLKNRVSITTNGFIRAVDRVLKTMVEKKIILFAEFLCPAGVAASVLGQKYGVPAYMQCGEAIYKGDIKYGNKKLAEKLLKGLTGVIAVSGQNKNYLVNAGVISEDKVVVLPSGYRKDRIYQRDKYESRKRLNFPQDKFIVGFCGSYDDRKGVLRLEKAVDKIEDDNVCFAAVGSGNLIPKSHKCIMTGPINHEDLAYFYSAIDVFAFPTYNEGCCTAIVEAIACGCPIISSDREFNYEICDGSNSILIEPDDIEEMKQSIVKIKNDDELRHRLSHGSFEKGKELSLEDKVIKILRFMNE